MPNHFSHLLGLELQDSGDGVRLSNTLFISFHSYEPVCPEKNNKKGVFIIGRNSLEGLIYLCAWHHQLIRGVSFKTSRISWILLQLGQMDAHYLLDHLLVRVVLEG